VRAAGGKMTRGQETGDRDREHNLSPIAYNP
jgi:hypothetical protein